MSAHTHDFGTFTRGERSLLSDKLLGQVTHVYIREYTGGRSLTLTAEYGVLHHLSYVGPNERILRKISTWGHRDEVSVDWLKNVWEAWDRNKLLRNIHPTHPQAYGLAERITVLEILQPTLRRFQHLCGGETPVPPLVPSANWPHVSVIIPLYGGEDDIRACLESLDKCADLLHEIVIVDNASLDKAADVASEFASVRLFRNDQNLGFSAACNRGAREASGDVFLFLNSDTVVPRAGLLRLIEALLQEERIGAVGPFTNNASQLQQLETTFTSLETLDLFADDFARREQPNITVDMLVGFCLALKRSVWEEIGGFDEGFGMGMFEDNDLSYRLRREGYRLAIAARSFILHRGSKSLFRLSDSVHQLFYRNKRYYEEKWQGDIEMGFASSLAGSAQPIIFDPTRHPARYRAHWNEMAQQANISLCIVVHCDEPGLETTLKSAQTYFAEIVVVETGPDTTTEEVVEKYGAHLLSSAWQDGYAKAWNAALEQAQGKWIFCMDACEVLSRDAGEQILHTVLQATPQAVGFTISVQADRTGAGTIETEAEPIRLFRNLRGLAFFGRAYERIQPYSLAMRGHIAPCEAVVERRVPLLSPEQAEAQRQRDETLLEQDLEEYPNEMERVFLLGATHFYGGKFSEAIFWFQKYLAASSDSLLRQRTYLLLASALEKLGQGKESVHMLEAGLKELPNSPDLHFRIGYAYHALGVGERAHRHYQRANEGLVTYAASQTQKMQLATRLAHQMGRLALQSNNYAEAKALWLGGISLSPRYLPTVFALFDSALEISDYSTAKQMLEQVQTVEGLGENWTRMGLRCAEALGGVENGTSFLQQTCSTHPTAVSPRLHLARKLLTAGREQEAMEHLRVLAGAEVGEAAFLLGLIALQHKNLITAIAWTEYAAALDPNREDIQTQLTRLRTAQQNNPLEQTSSGAQEVSSAPEPTVESAGAKVGERRPSLMPPFSPHLPTERNVAEAPKPPSVEVQVRRGEKQTP